MIPVLLTFYGSALLPLAYLLGTGFRGPRRGAMLAALGWHLALSLAVVALVWWSRAAGYSEWYWAWAYNVPVNVVLAIAYVAILVDRRD